MGHARAWNPLGFRQCVETHTLPISIGAFKGQESQMNQLFLAITEEIGRIRGGGVVRNNEQMGFAWIATTHKLGFRDWLTDHIGTC
jgi:hypothetical protein